MPSKDHNFLAIRSEKWLNGRVTAQGQRGAYEVKIDLGYVADYVSFCSITSSIFNGYCSEYGLKSKTSVYRLDKETNTFKDVISGDVLNCDLVCIFEAKNSRSDFLNTFGPNTKNHQNRHVPIGSLHWVVASPFICKPEEIPDFWGLLISSHKGLREIKKPKPFELSEESKNQFARSLLWPLQARRKVCNECGKKW